eukprot:8280800-Alexandrium_andersonii.AAC.2
MRPCGRERKTLRRPARVTQPSSPSPSEGRSDAGQKIMDSTSSASSSIVFWAAAPSTVACQEPAAEAQRAKSGVRPATLWMAE